MTVKHSSAKVVLNLISQAKETIVSVVSSRPAHKVGGQIKRALKTGIQNVSWQNFPKHFSSKHWG